MLSVERLCSFNCTPTDCGIPICCGTCAAAAETNIASEAAVADTVRIMNDSYKDRDQAYGLAHRVLRAISSTVVGIASASCGALPQDPSVIGLTVESSEFDPNRPHD